MALYGFVRGFLVRAIPELVFLVEAALWGCEALFEGETLAGYDFVSFG